MNDSRDGIKKSKKKIFFNGKYLKRVSDFYYLYKLTQM